MKKFAILLVALLGVVILAGQLSGARASLTSPVVCDEHPTQPWLCSPNAGTYADWPYLYGTNWGYDGDDGALAWNSTNVESDTTTVKRVEKYLQPGILWQIVCYARPGTKRVYTPPYYQVRGLGYTSCDSAVNFNITTCLQRRAPGLSTWVGMGCRSTPSPYPRPVWSTSIKRRCRSTVTLYYWRAEMLTYEWLPGWAPGSAVANSIAKGYFCY